MRHVRGDVRRSRRRQRRSGGGPGEGFLADTGRCNGRWVCRKFQMLEDLPDDLPVRHGRDNPQRPPLTPGAARHSERKHALEQSRPGPARGPGVRRLLVYALLSWRGDDRSTQVAVGRQTAAIAHQVDARQGHEGSQLLQKFHRRESNPCGPVRPRVRKGVDEIAIGVLLQTLQRHGTSRGRADQALQLIAPMGGDLGVGVQGEPVDAGTEGAAQERALALGAKARAMRLTCASRHACTRPKAVRLVRSVCRTMSACDSGLAANAWSGEYTT